MLAADSPLSVVIATRNRGDSVTHTIDSILRSHSSANSLADLSGEKLRDDAVSNGQKDMPSFEIVVVDQSTQDDCQKSMQKYEGEPRVIYQRTHTAGLATARNIAINQAKHELIAITDDDCIVDKNWLWEIQKAFIAYPQAVILFGNVLTCDYDASAGFIPSYCREKVKVISTVLAKNDIDGLGACMALRKSVWREFNGFDEMLGVGGVLKSSSEGDLVLHSLQRGYQVCETPYVFVIHHGFRTWQQASALIFRYWYGTGAMYGKHLKLYPFSTGWILVLLAWRWAFGRSRVADSMGRNTRKTFRLYAFGLGLLKGLWLTVERKTGHFRKTGYFQKVKGHSCKRTDG